MKFICVRDVNGWESTGERPTGGAMAKERE